MSPLEACLGKHTGIVVFNSVYQKRARDSFFGPWFVIQGYPVYAINNAC